MLDTLKNLAGGGKGQKQAEDLEALIARAQEERLALDAMLARIAAHASALTETTSTIEDVHRQIRESREELRDIRRSLEQAATLRDELGQLRDIVNQLTHDYSKAREVSREADDDAFAALEAVRDIEKRLGRLRHLENVDRSADDKLAALNAIASRLDASTGEARTQVGVLTDTLTKAAAFKDELINELSRDLQDLNAHRDEVAALRQQMLDVLGGTGKVDRVR